MSIPAVDPPHQLRALRVSVSTPALATVVFSVSGELDLATAPLLDDRITTAAHPSPGTLLVVDLTEVSFLGVAGIAVLLRQRARAVEHYARFRLVADSRSVLRPLYLLGLIDDFEIHATVVDALTRDSRRC